MRHVGDRERHDLGGVLAGARQPAALDPRQMLAHVFISPIGAPERSSARLTCCFCAKLMPSTGAIQFAEPPPDSSTSSRSSGRPRRASAQRIGGGLEAGFIGHGMAGLDHA